MSDEGFHEIQLNGKQLVFLFMAATVVSVVIFLCGVMVGRGVRVQQPTAEAATEFGPAAADEPTRSEPAKGTADPAPAPAGGAAAAPGSTPAPPEPGRGLELLRPAHQSRAQAGLEGRTSAPPEKEKKPAASAQPKEEKPTPPPVTRRLQR